MNKLWPGHYMFVLAFILSACAPAATAAPANTPIPYVPTRGATSGVIDASHPCVGAKAPGDWKHVVVIMFENKTYNKVIGTAPYTTQLAHQCATATNWMDADTKVDGSPDGKYNSKPNYATLTSGVSPSIHGLLDDTYETTTTVDNIYHQLSIAGLSFKDYYEGAPGGCTVRFSGDYHDAIRYYTDVQTICNDHDVPLATFMADLNSGNLPAFSMILPSKQHSMHDNSIASGDAYAQSLLKPLLNSPAYARGDVAIFFLWDENDPVANVLIAPSIVPGTTIAGQSGNPISHFSALRTWEEMLDLPLLGDTKAAPSLLDYFGSDVK